ncbi:uncharacterized protein CLUP02_10157 [Colletotrichum lupini]|uniref:Uncharacterized protein n=1 Tax=Colletotrichum lupini TaxID=145971 RepID=A0A9Q8SW58_9PEZI|nr:uncharacterized protein CLUP02_10157 [Colletotrichum lupini]UQC84661.1 hypothetical protein CLUP02_10157 [Colletotrichum lupini]
MSACAKRKLLERSWYAPSPLTSARCETRSAKTATATRSFQGRTSCGGRLQSADIANISLDQFCLDSRSPDLCIADTTKPRTKTQDLRRTGTWVWLLSLWARHVRYLPSPLLRPADPERTRVRRMHCWLDKDDRSKSRKGGQFVASTTLNELIISGSASCRPSPWTTHIEHWSTPRDMEGPGRTHSTSQHIHAIPPLNTRAQNTLILIFLHPHREWGKEDMSRGAREDNGASVGWSISRSASTRHDTAGAISLLPRSLVLYTRPAAVLGSLDAGPIPFTPVRPHRTFQINSISMRLEDPFLDETVELDQGPGPAVHFGNPVDRFLMFLFVFLVFFWRFFTGPLGVSAHQLFKVLHGTGRVACHPDRHELLTIPDEEKRERVQATLTILRPSLPRVFDAPIQAWPCSFPLGSRKIEHRVQRCRSRDWPLCNREIEGRNMSRALQKEDGQSGHSRGLCVYPFGKGASPFFGGAVTGPLAKPCQQFNGNMGPCDVSRAKDNTAAANARPGSAQYGQRRWNASYRTALSQPNDQSERQREGQAEAEKTQKKALSVDSSCKVFYSSFAYCIPRSKRKVLDFAG